MKTYVTKQGDTFDSIAFKILGHRRYTKDLMEANPQYMDIVIFSANVVLNIPEIETPDTTAMNQPPWRSS